MGRRGPRQGTGDHGNRRQLDHRSEEGLSDPELQGRRTARGHPEGDPRVHELLGMSKDGKNKGGALDLVNYLTTTQQQLQFAKDFGVMPSVKSAASDYKSQFPEMTAFLAGADYAQNLPAQPGVAAVLADLNSQMAKLKTSDPKSILDTEQSAMTQALAG